MSAGAWVVVVAVVAAVALGLWRVLSDGRFRGTHVVPGAEVGVAGEDEEAVASSVLADTPWADGLGERATLLQFSSAFCAPCRVTRQVLADAARRHPGVTHVEVDAEAHLGLVRRLGILRTPTTLVLDRGGLERMRATGAPRREQVETALTALTAM